jgi:hypothetical protein
MSCLILNTFVLEINRHIAPAMLAATLCRWKPQKTSFGDLPYDLCHQVYHHVLHNSHIEVRKVSHCRRDAAFDLTNYPSSVLQVCRQIREEIKPHFGRTQTPWTFSDSGNKCSTKSSTVFTSSRKIVHSAMCDSFHFNYHYRTSEVQRSVSTSFHPSGPPMVESTKVRKLS